MIVSFKQATLRNGLRVIAEVNDTAHTAAVGFFVRTGARDESPDLMGVSHFLEHMMFKGSERLRPEAVNEAFDSIGAEHNAFTSAEMTAFHAHVLPEFLPKAAETLSEIMRPALRQEDFDEEKGVILEEIAMYEDNPFWVLYELGLERYYGTHPLSHRVLGTKSTVSALTRDRMRAYFDARYSADNTVIAAAGRIDFDALVSQLERCCADWRATNPGRLHPAFTNAPTEFTHPLANAHRAYLLMMSAAPALDDPRRYAAAVLMHLLGDSEGSRLYWSLIETGLAEEAEAGYDGRDGIGSFVISAACPVEARAEVEAVIRREIDLLGASLTEDDLVRARRKIATAVVLAGERPAGRMQRIGALWALGRPYTTLDEEMARIESLTLDDLRNCLADFPPAPVLVGRVVPSAG